MKLPPLASLLLAAGLQVVPLLRAGPAVISGAAPILAIVFRLAALSAAVLGAVDAVSGATVLPPEITTSLNETVVEGEDLDVALTTAPYLSAYWTAEGLPKGLVLEGAAGDQFWSIIGQPNAPGVYLVSLTAYNPRFNAPVNGTLVLTVLASNGPPPKLLSIQSVEHSNGRTMLHWAADPGTHYDVVAAETLSGPWIKVASVDAPSDPGQLATAVIATDPTKPFQFYRVQLVSGR